MDLTGILPLNNPGTTDLAAGDFVGKDGLTYCGKCKTQKQLRVKFNNQIHVVGCLCRCASEELRPQFLKVHLKVSIVHLEVSIVHLRFTLPMV